MSSKQRNRFYSDSNLTERRLRHASIPTLLKIGLVLAVCTIATGCAGMVASKVSDADKVQSDKFDGLWRAEITSGGGIQYVGTQGLRCNSKQRGFTLAVNDGKVSVSSGLPRSGGTANVNSQGKFRLEIPTKDEFKGGNFNVQKPGITLVVQGNLAENTQKGIFVIGMQQLNNEGCSSRVKFKPLGKST